jgi:hypothetical protein
MSSPSQYADVIEILNAAIAAGGGKYTLETHGQAMHWRQRAYALRALLIEQNKRKFPDMVVPSPYDGVILTVPKKGLPGDNAVLIRLRKAEGRLTSLDNLPLTPVPGLPTEDEEDLIREIVGDLGLDL